MWIDSKQFGISLTKCGILPKILERFHNFHHFASIQLNLMRKNLQSAAATSRILREIISKPFQNAPICFIILYHFIDLYHIFLVVKDLNFLSLVFLFFSFFEKTNMFLI